VRRTPERAGVTERILALDVGTGTTDVLVFEPGQPAENSVKLVVPSRTQVVAAQIHEATRRRRAVVFTGSTMGGGPSTAAMRRHLAADLPFFATEDAALSFADNLERVTDHGVHLVSRDEVGALVRSGAVAVRSCDVELDTLRRALSGLGARAMFSGGCIAVQDHGFSPHASNRVSRFELWELAVTERRPLEHLFYAAGEVPAQLTRMRAAAGELAALLRVTAADTGPAALFGALDEGVGDAVLVNVGNGHTVCAVALDGRLAGVYEDHTNRLDAATLEANVRRFLAGELPGDEVREAGGHGATEGGPVPAGLPVLVTGPNRHLLAGSSLPAVFPAPYGDAMMTGPAGLIRAYRRRYGV
jgi:uncharacterized protein (DUF1786 family)